MKQGLEQGMKQGVKKDIKEGMEQGKKKAMKTMARNLVGLLDVDTISAKAGLSVEDIEVLKKGD